MSRNAGPDKQHYFPRMFLKGFSDQEGKIYQLKKKDSDISHRNKKSVAKKKHLYTVFSEQKDYSVETNFGKIENYMVPIFDKLTSQGFHALSDDNILSLLDFSVLTLNRTPLNTIVSEEVIRDKDVQDSMRAINSEAAQKYIEDCLQKKGMSFAVTIAPHFIHRHKVLTENFDACLFTAEEGAEPFILHDGFMCLEMRSKDVFYKENGKDVDWGKMNVIKHFPLSSRHCISFFPKNDPARKGTNQMIFPKDVMRRDDVRAVNQMALNFMKEYAYCANKARFEEFLR